MARDDVHTAEISVLSSLGPVSMVGVGHTVRGTRAARGRGAVPPVPGWSGSAAVRLCRAEREFGNRQPSPTRSSTAYGPLIGVKLHIITRKTLGGIQTDLDGRALDPVGSPIGGLYAAGEAAGFGGGGAHGYNALEGTFLGGCIFTGRTVGRSLARQL